MEGLKDKVKNMAPNLGHGHDDSSHCGFVNCWQFIALPLFCGVFGVIIFIILWHFYRRVKIPPMNLRSKNIFITGSSEGIGYELARVCLEADANVMINGRNIEHLNGALKELQSEFKITENNYKKLSVCPADVSKYTEYQKLFQEACTTAEWDHVDVVFANAGIECVGTLRDSASDTHAKVMSINYFGTVNTANICLPLLEKAADTTRVARFIATNSLLGLFGLTGQSAYAASKYAQRGFIESLHMELAAQNIYCGIAYPPNVMTAQLEREKESVERYGALCEIEHESIEVSPYEVANDMLKMVQTGTYSITWGIDGWMLRHLTVGCEPSSGLFDTFIQLLLNGFLRGIALFYIKNWRQIVIKHYNHPFSAKEKLDKKKEKKESNHEEEKKVQGNNAKVTPATQE